MDWHSLSQQATFERLKSRPDGLSLKEVLSRQKQEGPNELPQGKPLRPFLILVSQFKDTLVLILIAAAIVSFIADWWQKQGGATDAFLILIILLFNGIFGFIQNYKAERGVQELRKMSAPSAVVMRSGQIEKISARDLVKGDVILLEEGDIVPADARLIESYNLATDESSLTGESQPAPKDTAPISATAQLADRKNIVFLSTAVVRGRGKAVVVGIGLQTAVGQIAGRLESLSERPSPFQRELARMGKHLGISVLLIAAVVVLSQLFFAPISLSTLLPLMLFAASLAVAAVPEGLPAVVTICLALGSRRMVKQKALVRNLSVVESLGSVDVICTDKTGTLTENRMTVRQLYNGADVLTLAEKSLKKNLREPFSLLLLCGLLCNNVTAKSSAVFLGDPTEIALLLSAFKGGLSADLRQKYPRIAENPFSSERKMMSVVCRKDGKPFTFVKGAPEAILARCTKVNRNGQDISLTPAIRQEIAQANSAFASAALRVLGFAFKAGEGESDLTFLGLQGMIDPPRPEVAKAIADCKKAGIRIMMLTGDHPQTAAAIGKELGFSAAGVLTGADLDALSPAEFKKTLEKVSIYARLNPEHKLNILSALQLNHVVAMTGDGVNDAIALKQADIGIAMGIRGTDVAKQSSDMILLDDNFATIRNAIQQGRGIFDNIQKFVNYLLSTNIGELVVVFLTTLFGKLFISPDTFLVPLLPTHLLLINLLTDGLPALALSMDPISQHVLRRKPKKPGEGVLDRPTLFSILSIGVLLGLIAFVLFLFNHDHLQTAQTLVFTTLIMLEILRIHHIRSRYRLTFFSNRWLIMAMAVSLSIPFILLYTPLAAYFHVVPLGLLEWGQVLLALLVFYVFSKFLAFLEPHLLKKQS